MSDQPQSSSPSLSREEVEHVALLARLDLSPVEIEQYGSSLNRILGYFQKLDELDTTDVPPTSHPAPIPNVTRKDESKPSLTVEEALQNAPEQELNCFKTPPIIPES